MAPVTSYRAVLILYAALGALLAVLFTRVSAAAEAVTRGEKRAFRATIAGISGLEHSRHVVFTLSSLFALDAFGGGFVIQSFAAYWFSLRFGVKPETLGVVFFAANVPAGISALLASRLAACFGRPVFAGLLFARPSLINVPFFIAGTLKIAYDLLLYEEFSAVRPPEERDST